MPKLSVKSVGEVIGLPAYHLAKKLHEQKYPKQGPHAFQTPYYAVAKSEIRKHYEYGGKVARTQLAASQIHKQVKNAHKVANNQRVLQAFLNNPTQVGRPLVPVLAKRRKHNLSGLDYSLQFDLEATHAGQARHLFYNFTATPIDAEIARLTCEAAHWILGQVGTGVPMNSIEYVCLASGAVHSFKKPRAKTITHIQALSGIIVNLWPSI